MEEKLRPDKHQVVDYSNQPLMIAPGTIRSVISSDLCLDQTCIYIKLTKPFTDQKFAITNIHERFVRVMLDLCPKTRPVVA